MKQWIYFYINVYVYTLLSFKLDKYVLITSNSFACKINIYDVTSKFIKTPRQLLSELNNTQKFKNQLFLKAINVKLFEHL